MIKIRVLAVIMVMAMATVLTACSVSIEQKGDTIVIKNTTPEIVREESPEWVVNLAEEVGAKDQIFVVAAVGKTTAYVSMHEKQRDGNWKTIISTPGYIGKNGIGKTREGDGMTPVGTFHFNKAFGIGDKPAGCKMDYQKVTDDDWWSGDPYYHYNEMVKLSDHPWLSKSDSEHIIDYTHEYQYCLNISYNETGTAGLGSAIFLHCLGAYKPFTGGCVAISKKDMITVIQNVKPDCVIVIDSLENLNYETYESWGLD